jgi:hypothetical protein
LIFFDSANANVQGTTGNHNTREGGNRITMGNEHDYVEQLIREGLISLTAAAAYYPRNARGKPPHVAQVYRHATRGLRGVVLETVQAGSKRATSPAAIARFFTRLTQVDQGHGTVGASESTATATSSTQAVVEAQLVAERL